MRTILATILSVFSATAVAGDLHYLNEALSVYGRTISALEDCGLTVVDHEDPRVPRPQVPADNAIVGRNGNLLAYTNYETGAGNLIEFKAPNGGSTHTILFSSESISYSTPYAGTVAFTSRFRTVDGWHFRFICRSQTVDFATYSACVQAYFIDVITSQLCR